MYFHSHALDVRRLIGSYDDLAELRISTNGSPEQGAGESDGTSMTDQDRSSHGAGYDLFRWT